MTDNCVDNTLFNSTVLIDFAYVMTILKYEIAHNRHNRRREREEGVDNESNMFLRITIMVFLFI